MLHLIDKSAVVTEMERLKNISLEYGYNTMQKVLADSGKDISLGQLQYFLDTLETKEEDLDFQRFAKEMDAIFALPSSKTENTEEEPLNWEYAIAKHFFELGKAQKGE